MHAFSLEFRTTYHIFNFVQHGGTFSWVVRKSCLTKDRHCSGENMFSLFDAQELYDGFFKSFVRPRCLKIVPPKRTLNQQHLCIHFAYSSTLGVDLGILNSKFEVIKARSKRGRRRQHGIFCGPVKIHIQNQRAPQFFLFLRHSLLFGIQYLRFNEHFHEYFLDIQTQVCFGSLSMWLQRTLAPEKFWRQWNGGDHA